MIEFKISDTEGGSYNKVTKTFQMPYGIKDGYNIGAGYKPNCNKVGTKKSQKEISREAAWGQTRGFYFGAKNSREEQMSNPTIDKFKHCHFIFQNAYQRTIGGLVFAEMVSSGVIDLEGVDEIEVGSEESKALMIKAGDILRGEERNFCLTIKTIAGIAV